MQEIFTWFNLALFIVNAFLAWRVDGVASCLGWVAAALYVVMYMLK